MISRFASVLIAGVLITSAAQLAAQAPVRPYDGIEAGREAEQYHEARRRDAINRQLGWNEYLQWQSRSYYYEPYVPFGGLLSPDPYAAAYAGDWPYGAGRIFGYGFYDPVRQPIGRRQIQTGPNRWESFPIYADDLRAGPLRPAERKDAPAAKPVPRSAPREF